MGGLDFEPEDASSNPAMNTNSLFLNQDVLCVFFSLFLSICVYSTLVLEHEIFHRLESKLYHTVITNQAVLQMAKTTKDTEYKKYQNKMNFRSVRAL